MAVHEHTWKLVSPREGPAAHLSPAPGEVGGRWEGLWPPGGRGQGSTSTHRGAAGQSRCTRELSADPQQGKIPRRPRLRRFPRRTFEATAALKRARSTDTKRRRRGFARHAARGGGGVRTCWLHPPLRVDTCPSRTQQRRLRAEGHPPRVGDCCDPRELVGPDGLALPSHVLAACFIQGVFSKAGSGKSARGPTAGGLGLGFHPCSGRGCRHAPRVAGSVERRDT